MLRSAHLGPSSQVIVMILKTSIGLAFAAACLTAIVTMPVRADTARQNVIQSERYDRLLETNRAFRQARMRKECGPITDPQLHQRCLASFSQEEPMVGQSARSSLSTLPRAWALCVPLRQLAS